MTINMEKVDEVLDFIEIIKDIFNESKIATEHGITPKEYFSRGGCGQFYTILKSAFPEAVPYVTEGCGHVVTCIDGILYDIDGIYERDNVLEDVEVTPELEKVVSNYAFTLASSGWFWTMPGPTNLCFLEAIDDLNEEEKSNLTEILEKCDSRGIIHCYEDFKYNEEAYYDNLKEEIEGYVFFEAC